MTEDQVQGAYETTAKIIERLTDAIAGKSSFQWRTLLATEIKEPHTLVALEITYPVKGRRGRTIFNIISENKIVADINGRGLGRALLADEDPCRVMDVLVFSTRDEILPRREPLACGQLQNG